MYNQFQIFNLISFIIFYTFTKKGRFAKMAIMSQKVNHLTLHSSPHLDYSVAT
jgi:hypothetical protein